MAGKGIKIKMELLGKEQTERVLEELPKRVVKRALRQAVAAGSTPLVKKARNEAPKESGTLRKSITKKVKQYKGVAIAIVGANKATEGVYHGKRRVPAKYINPLMNRKQSPPDEFLKRAAESTRSDTAKKSADKLAEVFRKEADKLRPK